MSRHQQKTINQTNRQTDRQTDKQTNNKITIQLRKRKNWLIYSFLSVNSCFFLEWRSHHCNSAYTYIGRRYRTDERCSRKHNVIASKSAISDNVGSICRLVARGPVTIGKGQRRTLSFPVHDRNKPSIHLYILSMRRNHAIDYQFSPAAACRTNTLKLMTFCIQRTIFQSHHHHHQFIRHQQTNRV